ncbi:MAG: hypothetical protein ACR2G3_00870 [Solirubrobacterales bacterium]
MAVFLLALYGGTMVAGGAAAAAGISRSDGRLLRFGVGVAAASVPILVAALILTIAA